MAIIAQLVGSLGGSNVEEIPVSRTGMYGAGAVHDLVSVTVPAGERRLIGVGGDFTHSQTLNAYLPFLQIGAVTTGEFLSGQATHGAVVTADTTVSVVTNRSSGDIAYTGTVYVVDLD